MNSTYSTAFQKAFKIGSVIGILVLAYFFHTNADMCRVSHRELMSIASELTVWVNAEVHSLNH